MNPSTRPPPPSLHQNSSAVPIEGRHIAVRHHVDKDPILSLNPASSKKRGDTAARLSSDTSQTNEFSDEELSASQVNALFGDFERENKAQAQRIVASIAVNKAGPTSYNGTDGISRVAKKRRVDVT